MSAAAVLVVLGGAVLWYMINPLTRWRYRSIPGPLGFPIIGNIIDFSTKGVPNFCQELEPKYGKLFKFWFCSQPWVVVSDPEIARKLLLRFNTRPSFDILNVLPHSELLLQSRGLFITTDMTLWGAARKAFDSSLLPPTSLDQYTPIMDTCIMRLTNKLQSVAASGETIDMWRELGDMTLEIVGECAYGIDFHTIEDGRDTSDHQKGLGKELVEACRTIFRQARKHIRDVSATLIADWRAAHPKGVIASAPVEGGKAVAPAINITAVPSKGGAVAPVRKISDRSFLSMLLSARGGALATAPGKEVKLLDDAEIVQQALTFILAGYETTANSLAFIIYLLAGYPEVGKKLLEEVDAFGRSRPITTADLDSFPYVDAVVKEALRLHSPAAFTIREALEDLTVMGHPIPSGTVLVFPSHTFHNSSEYWKRPSEFLPERWLPAGMKELGPTTPNANMPFGMGARMCPGYKFANQESKIALVRLFQNFTFTLAPGLPASPRTLTGLSTGPADGVPVTVTKR